MTSPRAEDGGSMRMQQSDNWPPTDDHTMASRGDVDPLNGVSGSTDGSRAGQSAQNPDYPRSSSVDVSISGSKTDANYREKQVKVLRSLSICCLSTAKDRFLELRLLLMLPFFAQLWGCSCLGLFF
jgi:hypothetical protein